MNILLLGYIIRGPFGGMSWHHLHYVLALKQMGHNVLFLEDSDNYDSCFDPVKGEMTKDPSYGLNYIRELFSLYNLGNTWAYYDEHSNRFFNYSRQELLSFCDTADVVMNVSAVNPVRDWWSRIPVRMLIDTDPMFTQIKILSNSYSSLYANHHTHFFSFGENLGKKNCAIPLAGINWKPTRQPVYLKVWPFQAQNHGSWTTVMNWDSYKEVVHEGKVYGMKSLSFRDYFELPRALPSEVFEIAIGGPHIPAKELQETGWRLNNPLEIAHNPKTFQDYVAGSRGEWTVAKHGYVASNSGWFSERTLNYLASGRPAVVQDTGIREILPTGEGLLVFSSPEEAIEMINKTNSDYHFHSIAARKFVEEYFESGKVLGSMFNTL